MKKDLGLAFRNKLVAGQDWGKQEIVAKAEAREKEVFTEQEKKELEADILENGEFETEDIYNSRVVGEKLNEK